MVFLNQNWKPLLVEIKSREAIFSNICSFSTMTWTLWCFCKAFSLTKAPQGTTFRAFATDLRIKCIVHASYSPHQIGERALPIWNSSAVNKTHQTIYWVKVMDQISSSAPSRRYKRIVLLNGQVQPVKKSMPLCDNTTHTHAHTGTHTFSKGSPHSTWLQWPLSHMDVKHTLTGHFIK